MKYFSIAFWTVIGAATGIFTVLGSIAIMKTFFNQVYVLVI